MTIFFSDRHFDNDKDVILLQSEISRSSRCAWESRDRDVISVPDRLYDLRTLDTGRLTEIISESEISISSR